MDKWKISMNPKILITLTILLIGNISLSKAQLIFKNGFEVPVIQMTPLNDTGITWSGEYPSGNLTQCSNPASNPSNQDCNTGRDANPLTNTDTDGHAGFSFTKLDDSGTPLADQSVDYTTEPWACVKDNVTGLIWEVKTTTVGIHNKDNLYKWGGITAIGLGHPNAEGTYYNDWDELVNGSNAGNGLCGFTDWRVPKVDELSDLTNQGTFNPAIDTNYFPNTAPGGFCSSSPIAGNPDYAWSVYFDYGGVGNGIRDNHYRVRLVRSSGQ